MKKKITALFLSLILIFSGIQPFELQVNAAESGKEKIIRTYTDHKDRDEFKVITTQEDFLKKSPMNRSSKVVGASKKMDESGLYKSTLTGRALEIYQAVEKKKLSATQNVVAFDFTCASGEGMNVAGEYMDVYAAALWSYEYDHLDQLYWQIQNEVGIDYYVNENNNGGTIYVGFTTSPYYSTSKEAAAKTELRKCLVKAAEKTTVYDRLKYMDWWICKNCKYDYTGLNAEDYSERSYYAHTQLGLLLKKTGVCESYAKVLKLLCMQMNIPCAIILSKTHMFNYVYLNGNWYMIDCTWDDEETSQVTNREYFLISNSPSIDSDHKNDGILKYPVTSKKSYKYTGNEPVIKKMQILATYQEGKTSVVSSVSLNAGTTLKLRTEGVKTEVSYKSSDENIAAVSQDGTISGMKTGICKVTVTAKGTDTYSEAKKTVTVKVVPKAPAELKVTNKNSGSVLKWSVVSDATSYDIYRDTYKIGTVSADGKILEGNYVLTNASASGKWVTVMDEGSVNGEKYKYKVYSRYSTAKSIESVDRVLYRLKTPSVKKVTNPAAGKITVVNSRNSKCSGYQIQYDTSSGFENAKIATYQKNSVLTHNITGLKKGKTYSVRVRAYKTVDGVRYYSSWSLTKKITIKK